MRKGTLNASANNIAENLKRASESDELENVKIFPSTGSTKIDAVQDRLNVKCVIKKNKWGIVYSFPFNFHASENKEYRIMEQVREYQMKRGVSFKQAVFELLGKGLDE